MIQNTKYKIQNTNKNGFTLIEALVLLFIFSLITLTFYRTMSMGTTFIIYSKNNLSAIAIANEKMEIIRNMAYDDVGIQGGACAGDLLPDEDVIESGRSFHVHTLVAYVDDSFDGTLGGSPNDTAYKDYKLVKVTVSWNMGNGDEGETYLLSRFVPPGLEAATSGDGILSINVLSDQDGGAGVPQATVRVTNADLDFEETRQTDDSGNIMIVGAEESIQKYKLEISKTGYETIETYPPYPDTEYNPVDTHASVVAGNLNVTNIALNKLADLKIKTQDYFSNPIPSIGFSLVGGRKVGNEFIYPYTPIYNLEEDDQTDSSGEKEFDSISPGGYEFELSDSLTGYELIGTDPPPPLVLSSEDDLEFKVLLASEDETSVLVRVVSGSESEPFSGALVELSNGSGYSENTTTDANGTAFFPKTAEPVFAAGDYNLKVTASGYQDVSREITVSEDNLKVETVSLEAS